MTSLSGAGWRIVPGEIAALLAGLGDDLDGLGCEAGALGRVVGGAPTLQQAFGHGSGGWHAPMVAPLVEDYHGLAEWGSPFDGVLTAALDEAIATQAGKVGQVLAALQAAVIGVSQATLAYENGNEEMAATVQEQAAQAAQTGNFAFFDYLREQ